MKRALAALIIVVCFAILLFGKMYWEHQIQTTAAKARSELQKSQSGGSSLQQKKKIHEEKRTLKEMTKHLPEALAQKILHAAKNENMLRIVAAGSDAVSKDGWPQLLEERLADVYGEGLFGVDVVSFGDALSTEAWQQTEKIISHQPDIIILEPLTRNDTGKVLIEHSLNALDLMLQAIHRELPKAIVLLQPPNPYPSDAYMEQIAALRQYARELGIIYLSHWSYWPDPESSALNDYLRDGTDLPNEKGNKVWAEYLGDYLTSSLAEKQYR